MNDDSKSGNYPMLQAGPCSYEPPVGDCSCPPVANSETCPCVNLSNRWSKESVAKRKKPPRQRGLVAYLRTTGDGIDISEQKKLIDEFCQGKDYYIAATFCEHGKPGPALRDAMQACGDADGLIAIDLNRFVEKPMDRLRELRPFVHHFFCQSSKHLIAIEEGIDTGSTLGQANAITVLNHVKEFS
jgi:hypothetical protein